MYAPAYDAATASTDYGLPLISSEDVADLNYSRSTVEQVYTAIKQDLDDALPALLDKTPNTFRPAKNVAYGFLARMYLMRGEYDKALENAKKALEAFISTVSNELAKGEKIALIGFGTFSINEKGERTGINPATKQQITIPAKKVVKFKAGAELADKVK